MTQSSITVRRGVLILVLAPMAFFAAVALMPAQTLNFSTSDRSAIESIAAGICASSSVKPCPLQWSGKTKWFGTLPVQGSTSVASIAQLREVLAAPKWTTTEAAQSYEFVNGSYVVTYGKADGNIVITSAD